MYNGLRFDPQAVAFRFSGELQGFDHEYDVNLRSLNGIAF